MMERVNTFTHQLTARWHAIRTDDVGASMVEYALLVGLIAVVAIVAVTFFGTELAAEYDDIASSIP
ncbi:MAG TPA: Flp family type IVb pilin [Acidimicrobiia bacterium]|nr:Flp family type IVb pilin [Acidimicrobiia bacterium]